MVIVIAWWTLPNQSGVSGERLMLHPPLRYVVVLIYRCICAVPAPDTYFQMGKMSRNIEHDNEWGHAGGVCTPTPVVIIFHASVPTL